MGLPDGYVINTKPFPDHVLFGIGSSAFQIEGAWNEDGKGESIWDRLTHEHPEYMKENANADITADAYHHYEEDIERLRYLGVDHYRFSIAWTRILPNGFADNINQKGIDFYKKIIQKLKEYNIERVVTLYHWDLPQALQDLGGFHSDDFLKWFTDYARVCFKYFGDDVKYWITFNEPTILAIGYRIKYFAPGVNDEASGEYLCVHNLIKAHASAYHLYQDEFKARQDGKISLATVIEYYMPATNSSEDIEASKRTMEFKLGWVEDPLHFGDYPEAMKKRIAWRSKTEGLEKSRLPEFTEEEKEYIKNTTDFFGFNAYGGHYVEAQPESNIGISSVVYDLGHKFVAVSDYERPNVMPELLSFISKRYNYPDIFITENGIALKTVPAPIDDDDRIELITHYLSKFRDALDEGIKIIGYSAWSLLDTFEWNYAYTDKYGFYKVDFDDPNRTRTPKKSVNWYKRFLETRSLTDSCNNE